MPKRIQRKRTKGWKMPPECVYVGRPTRWGNPFGIDQWEIPTPTGNFSCVVTATHQVIERFDTKGEAVLKAVALYREMLGLRGQAWLDFLWKYGICEEATTTSVDFLKGKDLACWCPVLLPDGSRCPCHADVLLELANQ